MYTDHKWVSVDGKMVVSKLPGEPGFKTLSVEDLWTIPLAHADGVGPIAPENRGKYRSLKPIRIIPIPNAAVNIDLEPLFTRALDLYNLVSSRNKAQSKWYKPKTRLDKFRLGLHRCLLRWGVIV